MTDDPDGLLKEHDPEEDHSIWSDEGRLAQGNAREYLLAGNAVVTIRNSTTGNRFTYKVRQPDDEHPHFVSIPAGGEGWLFMGTIFDGTTYRHGSRSSVKNGSPSAKAFAWLWRHIDELPAEVEIWHEGSCLRCGRALTVPESIKSGYGPICAGLLGL